MLEDYLRERERLPVFSGTLELQDLGFGFLRSGAAPIFVGPEQVRRFSLREGDVVTGKGRAPKEGETFAKILIVLQVNGRPV